MIDFFYFLNENRLVIRYSGDGFILIKQYSNNWLWKTLAEVPIEQIDGYLIAITIEKDFQDSFPGVHVEIPFEVIFPPQIEFESGRFKVK